MIARASHIQTKSYRQTDMYTEHASSRQYGSALVRSERSCNSQASAEQQGTMQHTTQSRLHDWRSLLSSILLVCFVDSISLSPT